MNCVTLSMAKSILLNIQTEPKQAFVINSHDTHEHLVLYNLKILSTLTEIAGSKVNYLNYSSISRKSPGNDSFMR